MKKLFAYEKHCGRMGVIEGLFIAEHTDVDNAIGKEAYFGEILGKHSDVTVTVDAADLAVKSKDQKFIQQLEEVVGSTHVSGYNPLDYIEKE
jgi:hypothetical protein